MIEAHLENIQMSFLFHPIEMTRFIFILQFNTNFKESYEHQAAKHSISRSYS